MNAPPSASAAGPPSAAPPPPTAMRTHSPWRRLACDRCRSQKLRCVRAKENDTSRPCTRCVRIRYPCFTSSAKPAGRTCGRLPLAPELACAADAGLGAAPLANPATRRKASRRGASEHVSPAASPLSMAWPFIHDADQDEAAAGLQDGGMLMLTPSDEYPPIDFFEFLVDKNPIAFESVPLDGHFLRELDDEHHGAVDVVGEDQIPTPSQTPTPPVQCFPGVLLARLAESLSVQLVRLNTEPWDQGVLSVTGSTTDAGEVHVTAAKALTEEAPIFNPLLSILVSTAKFLDICRLFMPPESSAPKTRFFSMHETGESRRTPGTAKRAARPTVPPSLPTPFSLPCSTRSPSPKRTESYPAFPTFPTLTGAPTGQTITAAQLLTVVSCYLQVVTIYDDIFSHLLHQLALPLPHSPPSTQHPATIGPIPTGANTATSRQRHSHHTQQVQLAAHGGAPMAPSLVLAGYSVPLNAGLRMRLLVEVVEHQFEQIEHALGLPGQYCVSTSHQQQSQQHKTTGGGLLAGREATTLLETVMGLSIKIEGGGADAGDNADCDSTGVVASLRENLGKAQRVRRGGG